jgi:hypothetical protein
MKKYNTFGRKVAFKCNVCERMTRETGPDHAVNSLCEPCYELAGIDNYLNDNGEALVGSHYEEAVGYLIKQIAKLGGEEAAQKAKDQFEYIFLKI